MKYSLQILQNYANCAPGEYLQQTQKVQVKFKLALTYPGVSHPFSTERHWVSDASMADAVMSNCSTLEGTCPAGSKDRFL